MTLMPAGSAASQRMTPALMPTTVSELTGIRMAAASGVSGAGERQRQADGVVDHRHDEARDDDVPGTARVAQERRQSGEAMTGDHGVARRRHAGRVVGDGDAGIGGRERAGVVQAVANHQDVLSPCLALA